MNIPIISDLTKSIGRDYGVMLEEAGHTARGTFIIDGKGILRHMSVNDPPAGRNVDEYLRLVQAYQYVDAHGEVCFVPLAAGVDGGHSLADGQTRFKLHSCLNRIHLASSPPTGVPVGLAAGQGDHQPEEEGGLL